MGWRVVTISSRAKLELKMNYLVIRGEEEVKIFIEEISVLMIENTSVSLTCMLLEVLVKNKILVLFCDGRRLPLAVIKPLHGSYNSSLKIVSQIKWSDDVKKRVWTAIVKEKIRKQSQLLKYNNRESAELLRTYYEQVEIGDVTNREGFAAKVYFNDLFGHDFTRRDDSFRNAALNYGYSIILAAVSREIYANGYITEIGLFHSNQFNSTNLASDLMEVFRPVVDRKVLEFPLTVDELEPKYKYALLELLNFQVASSGRMTTLLNAIQYFCKGVFDAIEKDDISLLNYYEF